MKKVLVIGCPGAGKTTFAKELSLKGGLPLYHLDLIWWQADRTTISTDEFDRQLQDILIKDEWIIDGNYKRTMHLRLQYADTVIFLDFPVDVCLSGALERLGKDRPDIPWRIDYDIYDEFKNWILNYPTVQLPIINLFLQSYKGKVFRFRTRSEADIFLKSLKRKQKN